MEVKRLFDIFPFQAEKYPQEIALGGKYDGKWKTWSTQELIALTDKLAQGLLDLGMRKGDTIAIMSENRPEWAFVDQAILKIGAISIPIYPTSAERELGFVLNHAEVKTIFLEKPEHLEKVNAVKGNSPSLQHVFGVAKIDGAPFWETLLKELTDEGRSYMKDTQATISENDMATIIYTSGTTGDPKGVMLSHWNIVSNVRAAVHRLPVDHRHCALSFLPLSHIFERMISYMYFYYGVSVYYGSIDAAEIRENLAYVKPHVFTAVPRLLEKVFDRILQRGEEATGIKKKLFDFAVKTALQWEPDGKNGFMYNIKLKIANIVYKKFREAVGGRVLACASGSAALQPRLARFFNAAGIPLVEGYGLTETSPVITVNGFEPGMMRVGTVGKTIEDVQIKIAQDGEILAKGPNIMLGYYKRPDLTDEVLKDGWFHTGDIGTIDDNGFLRITDRKKEMFKTSGGKYIAPQLMENKFKASRYIEQVVVIGEYRKFPAALIVPSFENVAGKLKEMGVSVPTDPSAIIKMKEVLKLIEQEVEAVNAEFAQWERVKKFELLPREFSIDAGEITPKLSLKRKVIDQRYKDLIESMYQD